MRRLLKFTVILAIALLAPAMSIAITDSAAADQKTSAEENNKFKISNDLEQRGKQLRLAIDKKYKELFDTHALATLHVNNITPVVLQYIPVGTSFDNAEKILQAAGFGVGHHQSHPLVRFAGGEEYNVLALINPYTNPYINSLPYGTFVEIDLIPPSPGDYTKISGLSAVFAIFNPAVF